MVGVAPCLAERHTCAMTANIGERERSRIPEDTLAARLVLARHHAGRLSIERAAERCGLNPGNWAHWEDGRRPRDPVAVADAIEAGLGVDSDWLLRGRRGGHTPYSARRSDRPKDNRPNDRPRTGSSSSDLRRPMRRTSGATVAGLRRAG